MSLLREFPYRELPNFGGPWLLPDPSMVDVRGALLARNVEYSAGQVGTRTGYAPVDLSGLALNLVVSQMYAWYAPLGSAFGAGYPDSALVAFSPDPVDPSVKIYSLNLVNLNPSLVSNTGTPVSASFVGVGMRVYTAFHDANQRGAGAYGTVNSGRTLTATVNPLFAGPITTVPTTSETGTGVITAGSHRLAYLLEYASGFTTRVSPDSGASAPPSLTTFAPVTVVATGAKNLQVTINPAVWPNGTAAVSLVMTTVEDLNQYYIVPGSRTTIAGTTDAPKQILISVSDADLSSQGIDATPYLYWLTTSVTQTGPFKPSHLCLWGDRMAYKGDQTDNQGNKIDCLYVSERNNYQAITADQHLIQLPGQRDIVTMFRMGGGNYIVGPHEIYSTTDNGDVPVSWASPQLVDGRHGTQAIHGVEVAPSGQYAWIADQSGLYLFQGAPITDLPVSYYQTPDWNRINWGVAYTLQVRDDAANKRLYIMAALDSATTPSHLMVWDYTDGSTYTSVKYSLDNVAGYTLGAMELIRNDLSGQVAQNQHKVELWLGAGVSTPAGTAVQRRKSTFDTNPYRDNASAISSIYRTCPLPGRDQGQGLIQQHHGFQARLKGAGSLTPKFYDIDAVRSFLCKMVTLESAPDADLLFLADLRGELAFIEFASNTLDAHWTLAYLKYYYSPWLVQR